MSNTGFAPFTTTLDKTNRMLHEIEDALGWPRDRRNQSYAALRAVLHALRDRLTVEEAAQLGAQLPMLVRGIYYEGWDPTRAPVKMRRDEFFDRVRQEFRRRVTEGEWADIVSTMPKDLASALS